MGIRYYAYAFDNDQTDAAVKDPDSVLSDDPLADAWGFEHGSYGLIDPTYEQSVPERDMLYCDKVWQHLQDITRPRDRERPRPAYRMFEGRVNWATGRPWVRALRPEQVAVIAADLADITDEEADERIRGKNYFGSPAGDDEIETALQYLHRSQEFMNGLAAEDRGMVYTIG